VLRLRYAVALALTGLGVWMGLKPEDWQNWLGFSRAAYFVTGQNYALLSGFMPCFVTALGLGTLISGAWHHVNCHADGCPRIVRHKIAGGEYGVCGRHWREINHLPPDHKLTVEHLRDHHHAHLRATGRMQAGP
jgi:hypothetical protein